MRVPLPTGKKCVSASKKCPSSALNLREIKSMMHFDRAGRQRKIGAPKPSWQRTGRGIWLTTSTMPNQHVVVSSLIDKIALKQSI